MKIRDLMTKDPEVCTLKDSCSVAGQIMLRRNCGFVPVVDGRKTKRVIGVITDRDITLYLTRGDRPASQVPVEACMTRDPKTVSPETYLDEAAQIMESAAIHRLPVVEEGKLVGVLSLKDIACFARREWASAGEHAVERQMADIVESIAVAR